MERHASTPPSAPARPSLARDQSGAVMIIGVFMAMLVVGFLYYIIGIGNTLVFRERMQDAADSIAFSGAVMHARGMNLIAMINILMALLMAIYFVIWLVETMLILAAIACAVIPPCWPVEAAIGEAIDFFDNVRTTYKNSVLDPACRIGHQAESIIRVTWPYLAQTRVVSNTLSGAYRPPVTAGFLLPMIDHPLPVKAVGRYHTCDHAWEMIGRMVAWPLGFLGGAISRVITRFLSSALNWLYCPDNDESMGPYEIDTDDMAGNDVEYVQLRGVVLGDPPFAQNEQGVAIANWGRGTGGGGIMSTLSNLARVGLAQAEYYYEGTDDIDEWTWHMYWRARLRRFRISSALSGLSGIAGGADMSIVDRFIVH